MKSLRVTRQNQTNEGALNPMSLTDHKANSIAF